MFNSKQSHWYVAGVLLLALVLLAAGLSTVNNVSATSNEAAPALDSADIVSTDDFQAKAPWTAAQMLAAKPYPMPTVKDTGVAAQPAPALAGTPGFYPGVLPGGKVQSGLAVQDLLAPVATTGGYDYPAPHTSYEVFVPYTTWPYRTVGKLFFVQNGGSYVCSAASVGNYAIWTAGHCVSDGAGHWSTNVVFVPAYKDGAAPYGQWTATKRYTKTSWHTSANLREDMGGAVLKLLNGYKISQRVGALGFAWNWSYYQHWDLFGYPAQSPFTGKRLRVTEASFAYTGDPGGTGDLTMGVGSNLNGGASGGPWILSFGTGNYINGENSYTRVDGSGVRYKEMFSPHYGDNAKSLRDVLVAALP